MRPARLHLTDSDLLRKLMHHAPGGPLTIRRLAEIAGISKTRMDDVLHNRYPTVTETAATRIAHALGVHRAALFLATSSTSTDADKITEERLEHQRTLDADAYRLIPQLGQHGRPRGTHRPRA